MRPAAYGFALQRTFENLTVVKNEEPPGVSAPWRFFIF